MKITQTIDVGPPAILYTWAMGIVMLPLVYLIAEAVHLITGWEDSPESEFRSFLKAVFIFAPTLCFAAICTVRGMPLWMKLLAIPVSALAIAGALLMTFLGIAVVELPHCGFKGVQ